MTSDAGSNRPYDAFEEEARDLWRIAEEAIERGEASSLSDEAVAHLFTAAVKLYAAKADGEDRTPRPLLGRYDEVVTPSEALTAATELLRALRLGPMEFGLWSRRRPEDWHEIENDAPPIDPAAQDKEPTR